MPPTAAWRLLIRAARFIFFVLVSSPVHATPASTRDPVGGCCCCPPRYLFEDLSATLSIQNHRPLTAVLSDMACIVGYCSVALNVEDVFLIVLRYYMKTAIHPVASAQRLAFVQVIN